MGKWEIDEDGELLNKEDNGTVRSFIESPDNDGEVCIELCGIDSTWTVTWIPFELLVVFVDRHKQTGRSTGMSHNKASRK